MAMAAKACTSLRWWLVDNPTVSHFEWRDGVTFGASPSFAAAAVAAYLALTFLLHRRVIPITRRAPPPLLRAVSSLHNAFLVLLSLAMAAGCSLATLAHMPSPRWIFCFPADSPPRRGPVLFWAYVFYLSKVYEFLDTFLIILGGGDRRRLSFLHVYHHAMMVGVSYEWLAAAQSLLPVGVVTNAAVHVLMYAYYLSSSLGWRWGRYKRVVTDCQILQFLLSFAVSVLFLWFQFVDRGGGGGGGCSGVAGWVLNVGFNASLLALFLDFHAKNYSTSTTCRKMVITSVKEKKKM